MKTKQSKVLLFAKKPNWQKKGSKQISISQNTNDGRELMIDKLKKLCREFGDRVHTPAGLVLEILTNYEKLLKKYSRISNKNNVYREALDDILHGRGCEKSLDNDGNRVVILHEGMLEKISKVIEE